MKFSFIVTSLGKREQLQNCIDSIEKAHQHKRGLQTEILVVLQNVKEGSCDIKTRYPELSTFYYTDQKGLSSARNYAITRSKGDLLIFLDDDAQVKENFLSVLSNGCSTRDAVAFCGRILELGTDNPYMLCFIDNKKRRLKRTDFRYFMGSSHIFKKSAIDEIGLYDERFGAGSRYPGAEESDMFFRLKRRGREVVYLPELVYYHPPAYSPNAFNYSYAVGAMLTKQAFLDRRRLPVYLLIMSEIISKSLLRIFQDIFFPESIAGKNTRFRYRCVFMGTLKGITAYLKESKGRPMELLKSIAVPIIDICLAPLTFLSSLWLWVVRRMNIKRMKISRKIFRKVGLFPIRDHYFEPLFNTGSLRYSLRKDRILPGIDLNVKEQLGLLSKFDFNEELEKIPLEKTEGLEFYYHNGKFGCCDAQYLYNMIRLFKPKRIVEIGGGHSTLMAVNAVRTNRAQDSDYHCEHICIEPYECSWIEGLEVKVIRKLVEEVDKDIFLNLEAGDILFIDSSHIIRPQGDVLFEYLEILPVLRSGVLVHIHDIFTPKDYLDEWIFDNVRLWNEQYLLEAFLTFNREYRIIGALNHLTHNHFSEISKACPILKNEPHKEPCSFWMVKR